MSAFGERIRQLRKAAGLTQRELGDHVGMDFIELSKVENGRVGPPGRAVILRLAAQLGGDAADLLRLAAQTTDE